MPRKTLLNRHATLADAAVERSIPADLVTRTADVTLTANSLYMRPANVRGKTRVRRARLMVGTQAGELSVGAFGADRQQLVTSSIVCCPPAGAFEVALPPTDVPVGGITIGLSASAAAAISGNGSQGSLLGARRAATTHPLPATQPDGVLEASALSVQLLADDDTPLDPAYVYSRTQMPVSVLGQNGTKLYGRNVTTDKWAVSTDDGANWTDQTGPAFITAFGGAAILEWIGPSTYMYAVTDNGKIWRAPKDVFTTWTDVTPPTITAGTTGRVGEFTHNGSVCLYGNYNAAAAGSWPGAYLWRSTDDGANWTKITLSLTSRHVHAVRWDEVTTTTGWCTVGDDVANGAGLYKSTDSGATWTLISSSRYGIDIEFAYSSQSGLTGSLSRVILEGDGTHAPVLFHYFTGNATGSRTDPAIWADTAPTDGKGSWGGTGRCIRRTAQGNLIFATSSENNVSPNFYTRNALWIAKGPWFTTPVLLEEFPDFASTPSWRRTFISGSWVINGRNRIPLPKFAGQ
jgi:hypothetical protein